MVMWDMESGSKKETFINRSNYTPLPTTPDAGHVPVCEVGWARRRTVPISFAVTLLVIASVIVWFGSPKGPPKSRLGAPVEMKIESDCGFTEEDMDYWTKGSLYHRNSVKSAKMCRMHCEGDPNCGAWTWGKTRGVTGLSDVCFLKGLGHGQLLTKQPKLGVVSGLRCQLLGSIAEKWTSSTTTTSSSTTSTIIFNTSISSVADGTYENTSNNNSAIKPSSPIMIHKTAANAKNGNGIISTTTVNGSVMAFPGITTLSTTIDTITTSTFTITTTSTPTTTTFTTTTRLSSTDTTLSMTTHTETSTTTTRIHTNTVTYRPGSLFCFSLMLPGSYEQDLLLMQHKEQVSIFACDQYAIYSRERLELAPGVHTITINSDLKCEKGGEFGTALNLDIFIAVWTKVISDGDFLVHDWTVKVDPDAVFFPAMLRQLVKKYSEHVSSGNGVYLNNCKYGMHGPLEIFSVSAVKAWGMGSTSCVKHFEKLCSGSCYWGEDMFIDQCLWKVLKVKRVNEYTLLTEDHCDPPEGWQDCKNKTQIAFHPFKTLQGYRQCLANARS